MNKFEEISYNVQIFRPNTSRIQIAATLTIFLKIKLFDGQFLENIK